MKNKGNNYLKENGIHGGKYFYPLISDFSSYWGLESAKSKNLPNAKKLAEELICLPLYPSLKLLEINKITKIISYIK